MTGPGEISTASAIVPCSLTTRRIRNDSVRGQKHPPQQAQSGSISPTKPPQTNPSDSIQLYIARIDRVSCVFRNHTDIEVQDWMLQGPSFGQLGPTDRGDWTYSSSAAMPESLAHRKRVSIRQ
jgi:hypothetical protein